MPGKTELISLATDLSENGSKTKGSVKSPTTKSGKTDEMAKKRFVYNLRYRRQNKNVTTYQDNFITPVELKKKKKYLRTRYLLVLLAAL